MWVYAASPTSPCSPCSTDLAGGFPTSRRRLPISRSKSSVLSVMNWRLMDDRAYVEGVLAEEPEGQEIPNPS